MDEDRIAGAAQRLGGKAEAAAGRAVGDAKLQAEGRADQVTGAVRNAVGRGKDAVRNGSAAVGAEVDHLGNQAERLLNEHVTPALSSAAETVEGYVRQARDAVVDGSGQVSGLVRAHPLLAVGLVAAAGYLLGRLRGGHTYVHPWH